jgi:hypothetical protein
MLATSGMANRSPEDTTTRWFRSVSGNARQTDRADEAEIHPAIDAPAPFACTTCGRTDLPEAGGWDPPICEECDAAINEDAIRESMDDEDGWLLES